MAEYLIMWRVRPGVSHPGRNGVSTHDGGPTVRDRRRRAPRRDLSLYPARDVAGDRGRGPVPGDVPARLPGVPHARARSQRARVAVRDRDEPDPQSLSLRETEAGGVSNALDPTTPGPFPRAGHAMPLT